MPLSSTVAPGFTARMVLTLVNPGMSVQRAVEAASVAGDLRDAVRLAGARRLHAQPRDRHGVERARGPLDRDRQRVGDRRSRVAAFGERARPAEHQQPAAAPLDELADHAQLIAGERARFDAAENQAAVGEQLLARLRKAREQLLGIVDVEQPHVLVVRRALQRDDREVLVLVDRAPEELHLRPRLPFVVEHLLAAVGDVDERFARVVLR